MRLVFWSLLLSSIALASPAPRSSRSDATGLLEKFLSVGGVQRRYLVHLPPHFSSKSPAPLVFMLHGGGGRPDGAAGDGQLEAADAHGFVLVLPEGIDHGWNDGREVEKHTNDDLGFISALIVALVRDYNVDPKRVYSTGISNGGFMSFRLACELSDKVAAIAPVAASMGEGAMTVCKPKRPAAVLMINGTKDPLIHSDGGRVGRDRGRSEPVARVVDFWRKQNGCTDEIERKSLPDKDPSDGSTVRVESCRGKNGGEVINYTIDGGGHTWPSGRQYAPKFLIGNVNRDLNASEAIFDFFARH